MSDPVDLDDQLDFARGPGWHAQQASARAEWQAMRDLAVTVACPTPPKGCGMPIGAACVSRLPGEKPTLLVKFPAHAPRIALARKAQQ